MKNILLLCAVLFFSLITSCKSIKEADSGQVFSAQTEEKNIRLYTLTNKKNVRVSLTNYGARVVNLEVPDKNGVSTNVVLGYDHAEAYKKNNSNGAVVGRYANRINQGKFSLDGIAYQLERNNGKNALHGGYSGFSDKVWKVEQIKTSKIAFSYLSPDGEEGYPGAVLVKVVYYLNKDNGLEIGYTATTDKTTILNLTNHAYFNLNGRGQGDILGNILNIQADYVTPVDETQIPDGRLMEVSGTPFDFREPVAIGKRINADDAQLKIAKGYDINFVLNKKAGLQQVATAYSPQTGIVMKVMTEEPGMHLYTGNHSAFCLETQHFPDSPNHPSFPSTILQPGETYRSKTVYMFGVRP